MADWQEVDNPYLSHPKAGIAPHHTPTSIPTINQVTEQAACAFGEVGLLFGNTEGRKMARRASGHLPSVTFLSKFWAAIRFASAAVSMGSSGAWKEKKETCRLGFHPSHGCCRWSGYWAGLDSDFMRCDVSRACFVT